jgi:hypothetical protein
MAIRIDASGEYLRRTANLPTTGAWTACCWYYYTGDGYYWASVIALEGSTGNYQLIQWDGANFTVQSTGSNVANLTAPTTGAWYFVALVSNGTNLVAYKRTLAGVWDSQSISAGSSFTPTTLTFGADLGDEYINGRLAGIKVWNAALTAAEIYQEAETLRPQRFANLNLFCPVFPGERTKDYSGNGYTLTEGGTPTDEDPPPVGWGARVLATPYVAAAASGISGSLGSTLDDMTAAGTGKVTGAYFGTSGAAANGTTSVAVPHPTGISAGDTLVLMIANKYPTNAPTNPGGTWVTVTNGRFSGSSGTNGIDTGAAYISVFTKIADGTETGNLTVSISSGNSALGRMFCYKKAATDIWDAQAANGGSDNTAGTTWSVTAAADPGVTAGDWVIVGSGINTDAYTYASEAITQTGISSWDTMVERQDSGTNSGQDCGLVVSEHHALAGTSSAAPVYTMTANSSATNAPAGASVFLRLRTIAQAIGTLTGTLGDMGCSAAGTVADPGVNGSLGQTLGDMTAGSTGTVEVKGSLSKTLADSTLSSTGSAPLVISNGSLIQTLAEMTLSSAGTAPLVVSNGSLVKTLGDATLGSTGTVEVKGSAAATLADMTSVGTGTVGDVTSAGSLAATLDDATLGSAGTVEVKGSTSGTLADATLSSSGTVEVQGSTSATLADMTKTLTGTVEVQGSLVQTLSDATLSSSGSVGDVVTAGSLSQVLADSTLSSTGTVEVKGSSGATLADMTKTLTGTVAIQGSTVQTMGDMTQSLTGTVDVKGSLGKSLDAMTASGAGSVDVVCSLAKTLEAMIASGTGSVSDYVPAVAVILVATRSRALSFAVESERGSVSVETRSFTRACDERPLTLSARRARSLVFAVEDV